MVDTTEMAVINAFCAKVRSTRRAELAHDSTVIGNDTIVDVAASGDQTEKPAAQANRSNPTSQYMQACPTSEHSTRDDHEEKPPNRTRTQGNTVDTMSK